MKALHIKSGKIVAIKLLKDLFDHLYTSKKLISEIQIMRKLSLIEKNLFTTMIFDLIVPEVVLDDATQLSHLFIVMEYVSCDMQKLLK